MLVNESCCKAAIRFRLAFTSAGVVAAANGAVKAPIVINVAFGAGRKLENLVCSRPPCSVPSISAAAISLLVARLIRTDD